MSGHRVQDDRVGRFFSDFAQTWDTLYGGKRNAFWRRFDAVFRRDVYERYQLTFDRLGADLSGKSVLDIGCGSGVYCFEAARRGAAKVVGLDVAPTMIAHARETCASLGMTKVCDFVVGNFPPETPMPALAGAFDFAIAMGVMDYVADALAFLKRARAVVKGAAVLSFPGKHWLRGPVRQWRYQLLSRPTVYTYHEAEVRRLCAEAGFTKVDVLRLPHSGICYIVTARP